jgi:site-specific recombinase XerD
MRPGQRGASYRMSDVAKRARLPTVPMTDNTARAYAADIRDYRAWCRAHRRRPLPAAAATVTNYLHAVAETRRPATVRRRLAAIVALHRDAGLPSPRRHAPVRAALTVAEWHGRHRRRPTEPMLAPNLARCANALDDSPAGRRDRAVLLVAYGGALRRTELVGLNVDDLRANRDGVRITLERGAITVPHGSSLATCAVCAWRAWSHGATLETGPAFRPIDRHGNVGAIRLSDRAVTSIVQRAALAAGLDATHYTGRSLRLGMILSAAAVGATDERIMEHTGHHSRRLVHEYIAR